MNIKEWLESRMNVIIERQEKDIEKYTNCFNPNWSLDRNKEPIPPIDSSYQSLSAFLPASCFQTCLDIAHYAFDTSENNLLERKD